MYKIYMTKVKQNKINKNKYDSNHELVQIFNMIPMFSESYILLT